MLAPRLHRLGLAVGSTAVTDSDCISRDVQREMTLPPCSFKMSKCPNVVFNARIPTPERA